MDKDILINEAKRISKIKNIFQLKPQSREFIRKFAGESSEFYKILNEPIREWNEFEARASAVMESFIEFVNNGLMNSMTYEREIQIETVSDFLEQANILLNDNKIHPAAPAVLIGSALEEFLRNWLEELKVDLTTIKNSLDAYAQELKRMDLLNKQDYKDITAWAGIRNDAAHGHFDEVNNRQKIKIMLDGVNLFIRKSSSN